MNWAVWQQIEETLDEAALKPILAVIPDSQDPCMRRWPAVKGFWDIARAWHAKGWTIALHGYQHRYVTRKAGILRINRRSEFAGLPIDEQTRKLTAACALFRSQGLEPDAWVAPAHSFDRVTVRILKDLGIRAISDGLSRLPYRCEDGMLWVPQQIWRLRRMPAGVWTVCYHHNEWSNADLEEFRRDIGIYREQITRFDEVCLAYPNRKKTAFDRLFAAALLLRIHMLSHTPNICQTWRRWLTSRQRTLRQSLP
jgi:predicted deacetylase